MRGGNGAHQSMTWTDVCGMFNFKERRGMHKPPFSSTLQATAATFSVVLQITNLSTGLGSIFSTNFCISVRQGSPRRPRNVFVLRNVSTRFSIFFLVNFNNPNALLKCLSVPLLLLAQFLLVNFKKSQLHRRHLPERQTIQNITSHWKIF